jgi:hypothetical protein
VMTGLVLYQYERRQISYNHSQKHLLDS